MVTVLAIVLIIESQSTVDSISYAMTTNVSPSTSRKLSVPHQFSEFSNLFWHRDPMQPCWVVHAYLLCILYCTVLWSQWCSSW